MGAAPGKAFIDRVFFAARNSCVRSYRFSIQQKHKRRMKNDGRAIKRNGIHKLPFICQKLKADPAIGAFYFNICSPCVQRKLAEPTTKQYGVFYHLFLLQWIKCSSRPAIGLFQVAIQYQVLSGYCEEI